MADLNKGRTLTKARDEQVQTTAPTQSGSALLRLIKSFGAGDWATIIAATAAAGFAYGVARTQLTSTMENLGELTKKVEALDGKYDSKFGQVLDEQKGMHGRLSALETAVEYQKGMGKKP